MQMARQKPTPVIEILYYNVKPVKFSNTSVFIQHITSLQFSPCPKAVAVGQIAAYTHLHFHLLQ